MLFDQETHDMAIRFIEIYYKYFKDRFQFDDLVLCHGDLNLKNIIGLFSVVKNRREAAKFFGSKKVIYI